MISFHLVEFLVNSDQYQAGQHSYPLTKLKDECFHWTWLDSQRNRF